MGRPMKVAVTEDGHDEGVISEAEGAGLGIWARKAR